VLPVLTLHAADKGARLQAAYDQTESLENQEDQFSQALQVTDRALKEAKDSGDDYWYWKFRLKKVELLIILRRMPEAASLLSEPPTSKSPELKVLFATQKGWLCFKNHHQQCAVQNFLVAKTIAKAEHYNSLLPIIDLKLGNAYEALGNRGAAMEQVREAASLLTPETNAYTRSSVQGAWGYVRMRQQRYDEAIQLIEPAIDAGKGFSSRTIRAGNLVNLGYCYNQMGDSDRAAPLLDEAGRIYAALGRLDGIVPVLLNLGDLGLYRQDLAAAEDSFKRAAALAGSPHGSNEWLAESLNGLATVELERGNYPAASKLQAQAGELMKREGSAEPDLTLESYVTDARIAQALGRPADAEKLFQKAARMEAVNIRLALEARSRLAQLLADGLRPAEAEAAFRYALQRFDASRSRFIRDESKMAYDSSLIFLSQQYVEFLANRGRYDDALEVAEASRARLLLEHVASAPSAPAGRLRSLAASSKSTLLFYWTGPQRSWLWVIAPLKITHFQLPPEAKLQDLAARYRRESINLQDPVASEGSAGWPLSAALLDPVRSNLGKGVRVMIVPSGPLFEINLAALPVDRAHPHYFIEDAEVTVAPSLSLLLSSRATPHRNKVRLLAVGDIDSPDKAKYADLASATAEIQHLTTLFPGAVTTRTHADAVPGAYLDAKPAQFSMIHFATHAEANRVNPLDSAVILSRRGDQYKLYARDIQSVPIRADLVTISSCRSAGSRTYAGEGLVGFAWAFLAAGARHVVAGLWDVDDRSTSDLMDGMYEALKKGLPPSQALREAQLNLLKSKRPERKPYYWAPFEVFANTVL
jgi:CHAT domain-containing protein